MALGLRGQVRQLQDLLSPGNRYTDIAVQFVAYRRVDGVARPTSLRSEAYGGRYDQWSGQYTGETPTSVLILPCSEMQFELVTCDSSRIEGNGGRGSGKSEGGVLRALRYIAERPNENGQCVSPWFDLTKIIWSKLLAQIPRSWLLPGKLGILRSDRELRFANGVAVRFRSADNPDSLRSWGGGWTFVDEEQDVTDEAVAVIWPSLRCSARPCLWSVGTPKAGEYRDRHERLADDPSATVLRFDSYSNPFVSPAAFELSKSQMTADMYRQEILAEWIDLDDAYVCRREFDPLLHSVKFPFDIGKDITRAVTQSRVGAARAYVAGVDYNLGPPCCAWVYRVFAGKPNKWIVVDIIHAYGEASNLAAALKEHGYTGANTLVIDDASGEYNKYGGKRSANSSARLMRNAGYMCIHPKKNPRIKDRVNALLVKMKPAEGEPTWLYDSKHGTAVRKVMKGIKWSNQELDKSAGVDHDFDAATYPLHFFCPPAVFSTHHMAQTTVVG